MYINSISAIKMGSQSKHLKPGLGLLFFFFFILSWTFSISCTLLSAENENPIGPFVYLPCI